MPRRPIPVSIRPGRIEVGGIPFALDVTSAVERFRLDGDGNGIYFTVTLKADAAADALDELVDLEDVNAVQVVREASILETLTAFEIERAAIEGNTGTVWENILDYLQRLGTRGQH